jgi:adenosylcobinamide-phosphate synthase
MMAIHPYYLLVPPLALILDGLFGDPPNRFHPTAWMGSLIHWLLRFRPRKNPSCEFMYGILILFIGLTLTVGTGLVLADITLKLPIWTTVLFQACLLKLTLSLRGLYRAAGEVQSALQAENLSEARRLLSWHLVSRDTSQLNESQVSAAAIESVAENASDGTIAPLFFYAIGGLPMIFAYRFINTADSMLGYRDPEREWLGKAPARLDDLFNLIPARLTGILIILSEYFIGVYGKQAWEVMRRDGHLTASPNAGVPMSAMAGALDVVLEKVDHYELGKGLRIAQTVDLGRARHLLLFMAGLSASIFLVFFIIQTFLSSL